MPARTRLRLAVGLGLLVVTVAGAAVFDSTGVAASDAACAICGRNLIENPGAESGTGANADAVVPVPDWKGTGGFTAALYTWSGSDVSPTSPGPPGEGKPGNLNYFWGGPDSAVSTGTQSLSLAGAAGLTATLSGWLGGYETQADDTTITVSFLGSTGQTLGTLRLGPVTEAERKGVSEMLHRSASSTVPSGSVDATVVMRMIRSAGSDNDGLADELSLVIGQASGAAGATTTSTGSTTSTAATASTATTTAPAPVSGVSADVQPVSGTVLVDGKPLVSGERIPLGATVDATKGKVTLESVSPTGAVQSAQFYDGAFTLQQPKGGVTSLILKGGDFAVCSKKGTRRIAASTPNGTIVRSLWGSGHGQFATQGRYAAATVRGTVWETEDRCDGTEIVARRDSVTVRDLVTRKTIVLKAGQSFLAKP